MSRTPRAVLSALIAAAVLVGLPVTGRAQPTSDPPSVPPYDKGGRPRPSQPDAGRIELPVHVFSRDQPVRGLGPEDFEILAGGETREMVGLEVVDLVALEPRGPEGWVVPRGGQRHFLILFDLSLSAPESIPRGQQAARDLLAQLHPADLAAVATYRSVEGIDFLVGFTSDRRQTELAIATLGLPELVERTADPLGLRLGEPTGAATDPEGEKRLFEVLRQATAAERIGGQSDRVVSMCRNLSALAELLATIAGPKHVVYLSEGFASTLYSGGDDRVRPRTTWQTNSEAQFGQARLRNDVEDMVEAFRRAGAAVHTVMIGSLRAGGTWFNSSEAGLIAIARGTGGEFLRTASHLGDAIGAMLSRTSVTYVVAFRPGDERPEGEYQAVEVRLRAEPRGGATVVHRAGYHAPRPFAQVVPLARRLAAAELLMSGQEQGPFGLAVLAAAVPVAGARAYVPVLIEVDGAGLLADYGADQARLELFVYAVDAAGGVHDFFTESVGLDLAKVRPQLARHGLKYQGHLDLPPGDYALRVLVRCFQTGRSAVGRATVAVPAEATAAVLLPPLFPEPPGKWLLAREPAGRQRDVPSPFTMDGRPYVPAARPVVPKRGRIPVFVRGFNLPAGDGEIEARVLSAAGEPVDAGRLWLGEKIPAANGGFTLRARFESRWLEAGEYTLVITAPGSAGGKGPSSSIRFLVDG